MKLQGICQINYYLPSKANTIVYIHLINLMESDRRIVRYVDLPIQHSHDDILKSMRRKTNSDHIKNTIRTLRERLSDIYIRTSLMVGFPGETEGHFQEQILTNRLCAKTC